MFKKNYVFFGEWQVRKTHLLELCLVATDLDGGMVLYKRFGSVCFDLIHLYVCRYETVLILYENRLQRLEPLV